MNELATVPLDRVVPLGNAELRYEADHIALVSDPDLWAYSALAEFDIPGIDLSPRVISVAVAIEAGVLGLGWSSGDRLTWVVRSSAGPDPAPVVVRLAIPAGSVGGILIFDNWTEGGEPVRARICGINILEAGAEADFHAGIAAEETGDTASAIAYYTAALRDDPAHVESIAGLGRLRFIPPAQPLLDEMERRMPAVEVCEVTLAVHNPCNYRCFYCTAAGHNNEPVERFDFEEIEKHYAAIACEYISTGFECGGGEPTVHPEFKPLLALCAHYGSVTFPSNNSQNPRRWLPRDVASHLYIRGTLHPEGEEKLEQYLDNAKFLLDAGCNFCTHFVAHPSRLDKLPHYAALFEKHGIPFVAKPLIGTFNGVSYPFGHTQQEQDLIERYARVEGQGVWNILTRISSPTDRIRNFRGIDCISGHRLLYIWPDGRLQRCLYDPEPIDAPRDRATPCRAKSCGCGLSLEKLNFSQTDRWIRLPEIDTFAVRLGYENVTAGVAAEYLAMYDALMAAYGKDEFPEEGRST